MDAQQMFLSQLPSIERIATFVCRRNRMSVEDTEDFVSLVKLKLIQDDYHIVRQFEGRSSFSTYITTVITRLLADYRVSQWGKWRPSAEAKRLGDTAILLERLISRDGYTFEEAAQILTTPRNSAVTVTELEAIYRRLPVRGRPYVVDGPYVFDEDDELQDDELGSGKIMDPGDLGSGRTSRVEIPDELGETERERTAARIGRVLEELTANLDPEEQLIIRLRFFSGLKVPEIARQLHMDQKKLYRRIERILIGFRKVLAEQQIDAADVESFLAHSDSVAVRSESNVRTVKSADSVGIYVDPSTARRTLEELQRDWKKSAG
jgi:RNA polymerase sigma factor (sigma-70 family)